MQASGNPFDLALNFLRRPDEIPEMWRDTL
jgi:hypothetical protein